MASSQKLTEYEHRRLENIRCNEEMMAALRIHSKATQLFSTSSKRQRVEAKSNNLSPEEEKPETQTRRKRVGKCSTQWNLHERMINSIDFNSENFNIMATSSSDGTACIWDLRSVNVDQPKPLKEVSHNRAVQSAYFSPSGSSLATTSMDNTVGIVTGVNFERISMIEHDIDNQINSRIASFRAIWGWDDSYIFISNRKRGVDVISSTKKRTIFTNPRMPAIPSRFDAHPCKVGTLAGATCWGHVYIWKLG